MQKINNKKIINWITLIAWMSIIFIFSNQPAIISDKNNEFIINVLDLINIDLNSMLGEVANFVVRKLAHLTEYFILYILILNVVKDDFKYKYAILIALSIVFIYACSDEIHQNFVPGRSCQFIDVLIDTFGGMLAALYMLIYKFIKERK